jgi:hypothetical protein
LKKFVFITGTGRITDPTWLRLGEMLTVRESRALLLYHLHNIKGI